MSRLAVTFALAALALPASAMAAERTARYSVEMRVSGARPVPATAELWLDTAGRVRRLHATAHSQTKNLLITLDERITAYGGPVAIAVPPKSAVYLRLP